MRKTKIVCTLGPATDREGVLRQMLEAGMNVARFNFSHGSHAEHKGRLDALKALRAELGLPVAAMLGTKGPEVRLKSFAAGSVMLRTGQEFTLTTRDIVGDEQGCSITYADLPGDVKAGDTILLDDGLVRLTVLETTAADVRCRVENDGAMKNNKGVNVPGIRLSMPYMSQRDREDILFGVEQGFDFIAASFVRTADDVREIRRLLDEADSSIQIIGSGGNINKLFRLADKKDKKQSFLPVESLQEICETLKPLSKEERIKQFKLKPDRADVIVPAAEIFLEVAKQVNATGITVPTIGLSDGIIDSLYTKNMRTENDER